MIGSAESPKRGTTAQLLMLPVVASLGRGALQVMVAVSLLPQALLSWGHINEVPAIVHVGWCAAVATWLVSFWVRSVEIAYLLVLAGILANQLTVLLSTQPSVPVAPLHLTSFAFVLGAALCLETFAATCVLIGAIALDVFAVFLSPPAAALYGTEFAGGFAGPVYLAVTGMGLLVINSQMRKAARREDQRTIALREVLRETLRSAELASARLAAARIVHETVLNTLGALSRRVGDISPREVQLACQRDLESLRSTPSLIERRTSLNSLIEMVVAQCGIECSISCTVRADVELDPVVAQVLRDAVTEALMNVRRHSRASEVSIVCDKLDNFIEVVVKDNGIGVSSRVGEHFGLRVSIGESIDAIGGESLIESPPDGGTQVTLRIPTMRETVRFGTRPMAEDILLESPALRLAILSPALGTLIFMPWVMENLTSSLALSSSYAATVGASGLVATMWRQAKPLSVLVYVMSLTTIALYLLEPAPCDSATSMLWMFNGLTSCVALSMLIRTSLTRRWMTLGSIVIMALQASRFPPTCSAEPWSAVFISGAVLSFIAFSLSAVLERVSQQREVNDMMWWEEMVSAVETEAEAVRLSVLTSVSPSGILFLEQVAQGILDPAGNEAVQIATVAEANVRSRLTLAVMAGELGDTLRAVVDLAQLSGTAMDVSVIATALPVVGVPDAVREALRVLACSPEESTRRITVLNVNTAVHIVVSCSVAMADAVQAVIHMHGANVDWERDDVDGIASIRMVLQPLID